MGPVYMHMHAAGQALWPSGPIVDVEELPLTYPSTEPCSHIYTKHLRHCNESLLEFRTSLANYWLVRINTDLSLVCGEWGIRTYST